MQQDKIIREELLMLLNGGNAHMSFEEAIENFPMDRINDVFPNGHYSAWHLLEHIRITQWDILDFIINPNYKYMEWPKDYWPKSSVKATKKDWDQTILEFQKNLKALRDIVKDSKTDFYSKIKWGEGQTIFREILLVCDHTAYHVGEFAIMREVEHTWPKGRR